MKVFGFNENYGNVYRVNRDLLYWKYVYVVRQSLDFLEVWIVMVIFVEFWKFDFGLEVFCEDFFFGQVSMELGSVNLDFIWR